jgi:hypothetical protein
MQPCPNPWCRLILAQPEDAPRALSLVADAPARDEGAGECWIGKVDRDGVVEHAARSRRRHGPPVRAAILVEPGGHSSVLSAEALRRDGDADADREPPFCPRDQLARIASYRVFLVCST